eukprot:2262883-Amphidinium_carterae.1
MDGFSSEAHTGASFIHHLQCPCVMIVVSLIQQISDMVHRSTRSEGADNKGGLSALSVSQQVQAASSTQHN